MLLECITNKRKELEIVVELHKPKIIGVVESWCHKEILDSELTFRGYNLFRTDKEGSKGVGGGALLYIHQSLDAVQCYKFDHIAYETSIWCEINLNKTDTLLVGLIYRSPNTTSENSEALRKQLLHMTTLHHISHTLVFGDFNFPEIKWKHNTVSAGPKSEPQMFF